MRMPSANAGSQCQGKLWGLLFDSTPCSHPWRGGWLRFWENSGGSFIFGGEMLLHKYPISKVYIGLKIIVCAGFFHPCLISL